MRCVHFEPPESSTDCQGRQMVTGRSVVWTLGALTPSPKRFKTIPYSLFLKCDVLISISHISRFYMYIFLNQSISYLMDSFSLQFEYIFEFFLFRYIYHLYIGLLWNKYLWNKYPFIQIGEWLTDIFSFFPPPPLILTVPYGMQDLSSLTRDRTHASCSGSVVC